MLSGIVWFQGFFAYVVIEGCKLAALLFLCNLREEQLIFPPAALYLCTDAPQFSCYTVSASVQCGPADLCQRFFSLALNKPSLSGDWETAKSGPSRSPLCLTVWTSLMPAINHVFFLFYIVLFCCSTACLVCLPQEHSLCLLVHIYLLYYSVVWRISDIYWVTLGILLFWDFVNIAYANLSSQDLRLLHNLNALCNLWLTLFDIIGGGKVTQIYSNVYILKDCLSNLLLYPGGFIA